MMRDFNQIVGPAARAGRCAALAAGLAALAGCAELENFAGGFGSGGDTAEAPANAGSTTLVERDVEAPEVFQVTEAGLWDGRPSLGGVWVAHPDVTDPERVIIRNTSNDKFVIGALFRRERAIPGPRLQVSSDAAAALGMLAGAPVQLNVTALRREEAPADPEPAPAEAPAAPAAVVESTLDPVAAGAAEAIAATEAPAEPVAAPQPAPKPKPKPARGIDKPYVQIGIFSVEANAERAADQMRAEGMVPTIRRQSLNGKPFWRVVVGPARTTSERDTLLRKIRGAGFSDAYAVTN